MPDTASELIAELLTGTVTLLDIPAELQAAAEATWLRLWCRCCAGACRR